MIRTKHNIDTELVNFFISKKDYDSCINMALLEWYGSLDDKEHEKTREKAIFFLASLSKEVLNVIDYPTEEREKLVGIFEPLEKLLRIAISLKDFENGKAETIRDHLSHTVRNVIFTNYLLSQYRLNSISSLRNQIFIASIFHDLAYPIEKIKKVAKKLGDATFRQLLNSAGKVEIELNNSDDLLQMLNFFGEIRDNLIEKKNKYIDQRKPIEKIELSIAKIEHIYKFIINPAIASQGLFDSSHSISSVVLFLRPIIKYWKDSKAYYDINFDTISDICLSMAYHDRKNDPNEISFEIPEILKIMRITDELQEWDRERLTYIEDVKLVTDTSSVLSLKIIMKDKNINDKCRPEKVIPDKIIGILPVIKNECIKVYFTFPRKYNDSYDGVDKRKDINSIKGLLKSQGIKYPLLKITGSKESDEIEIIFKNTKAEINFK